MSGRKFGSKERQLVDASVLRRVREERDQLKSALKATLTLAAVSWEGDSWYAEQEGIDGEAVLAKARKALSVDRGEE